MLTIIRKSFIALFFVFTACAAIGQQVKFDHLSVNEGLSQGNVWDIKQDKQGFIWIATEDGLNKFNGYTFAIYKNKKGDSTSLSSNIVASIAEDQLGYIWVGTREGLNRLDQKTNTFTRFFHSDDDPQSLAHSTVATVYVDSQNNVWVCTNGGLSLYDRTANNFINYHHDPAKNNTLVNDFVKSIYEDNDGILWIGTMEGISRFDPKKDRFTNFHHDPNNPNSPSSDQIMNVFVDKDNNVWIGTFDAGLVKYDQYRDQFVRFYPDLLDPTKLPLPYVYNTSQEKDGTIWVSNDGGLCRLDEKTGEFTRYVQDQTDDFSLNSNIITDVYFDKNDRMLVGTRYGGLNIHDKGKYGFDHLKQASKTNSLSGDNVQGMDEDAFGNIWIGVDGSGLNKYNPQTGKFIHYQHDPDNANSLSTDKVLCVEVDQDGNVWSGTWRGGVIKFNPATNRFTRYLHDPDNPRSLSDNSIFDLFIDQDGVLWVATWGNGISRYHPETDDFTQYEGRANDPNTLPNSPIVYMTQDHTGLFWLGTEDEGLYLFDKSREKFTNIPAGGKRGLSTNGIYSIYEDSQRRLWVGTGGGGLNLYDREKDVFTVFTEADGLPNEGIVGILEDNDQNLWLSTNKGLSKFNPEKGTFKNYTKNNGLQGDQFNRWSFLRLSNGKLLFGGTNGLNIFDPDQIKDNDFIPPVYITDFRLYSQEVAIGKNGILQQDILFTDELVLDHTQNFISLEFTALNYRESESNQYKYIMEGLQEEWVYTGTERKATFTNLDPGEYTFKVVGSNNDGYWNEVGRSLKVVITPPWWATWWFRIAAAILLIAAGVIVYRWRSNMIKAQKAELEARVKEATEQVIEQNEELKLQQNSLQLAIEDTNYVIKEAVESGNFSARIDIESKTGEWRALGESINRLFESILLPFNFINEIVNGMAQSDLSMRYTEEARGDVKRLTGNLNEALNNLSELLSEIISQTEVIMNSSQEMLTSSEEMNVSSGEIASSIGEISRGAQNQVKRIDESSNLLEGILRFSNQMAEQADSINQAAIEGVEHSDRGKELIGRVDSSMQNILSYSLNTNESIETLAQRSGQISQVLSIIKGIASQTNLLALNAAIEAAKAGEEGRGFATVAEEIRKLAEGSSKSVKEIEVMVADVQSAIRSTTKVIEEMNSSIKGGEEASRDASASFEELATSYAQTHKLSELIVDATKHQTSDISSVVDIMESVVVISEQTAAGTEEIASSSSELSTGMAEFTQRTQEVSKIVEVLKEKVGQFKVKSYLDMDIIKHNGNGSI